MKTFELLQKISTWAKENNYESSVEDTPQGVLSALKNLHDRLERQPEHIFEILHTNSEEEFSEAVHIANLMQFLSSKDPTIQEQGYQLLTSLNSEAVWESIMTGATIADPLKHDSYRMTAKFKTLLLSNPFWDYSNLTSYRISQPFAEDCQHLHLLTALSKLTINLPSPLNTLDGLGEISNLHTLEFYMNDWNSGRIISTLFSNTKTTISNIKTVVLNNLEGSNGSAVDLSLFQHFSSLERVIIQNTSVTYTHLPDVIPFQIELHVFTKKGHSYDSFGENFLPKDGRTIRIAKLRLIKDDGSVSLHQFTPHRIDELESTDSITILNLASLLQQPPYPKGDLTKLKHQYEKFVKLNHLRATPQKLFQTLSDYLQKPQQELSLKFSRSTIVYPLGLASIPISKIIIQLDYKSFYDGGLPGDCLWFPRSCRELEVQNKSKDRYFGGFNHCYLPSSMHNLKVLRLNPGAMRPLKTIGARTQAQLQTIVFEFASEEELQQSHLYRQHKKPVENPAILLSNLPKLQRLIVHIPSISSKNQNHYQQILQEHINSTQVDILFSTEKNPIVID